MHAVKIGHSIANIEHLRARYSTAYGSQLEIGVFQVENKKRACQVETAVHKVLIAAGFHINNEIFRLECMKLFESTAASLCNNYVSTRPTMFSTAAKQEAKDRKLARAQRTKDRLVQKHAEEQAMKDRKIQEKKDAALWILAKTIHKQKHDKYRQQENPLTDWVIARVQWDIAGSVMQQEWYEDYFNYATDTGKVPVTKIKAGKILKNKYATKLVMEHRSCGNIYRGMKLRHFR